MCEGKVVGYDKAYEVVELVWKVVMAGSEREAKRSLLTRLNMIMTTEMLDQDGVAKQDTIAVCIGKKLTLFFR